MAYVVALVGLVAALNLLLTFGVIRRLREHGTVLANQPTGGTPPKLMLSTGETAEDFAATTVDGEPLSRALLAGQTLVGFFSVTCSPCREQAPVFAEVATRFPGNREQVLAVIAANDAADAEPLVTQLQPVARVVVEGHHDGPVSTAFAVRGSPVFGLVGEGGVVISSGLSLDELPVPTNA